MPVGGGAGGGGAGANQSRLVLGMFSIYPAFGYILPGGQQTITVDCIAETPGRCEEVRRITPEIDNTSLVHTDK